MRARHDWSEYEGVLPSSTELYGIFQPLMGWKSGLAQRRFDRGLRNSLDIVWGTMLGRFEAQVGNIHGPIREYRVEPGRYAPADFGYADTRLNSVVAREITARAVRDNPDKPEAWLNAASPDSLKEILGNVTKEIAELAEQEGQSRQLSGVAMRVEGAQSLGARRAFHELQVAGLISLLAERREGDLVRALLYKTAKVEKIERYLDAVRFIAPDKSDLLSAVISPIGILHSFRQYFFELDSFLGVPVQHIWLSPGSSLTLVEVSTRRQLVERFIEQATETTNRSESSTTTQDELSDAVRDENSSNTKLGVGVDQSFSYGVAPLFSGSTTASVDFSIENGSKSARETVHKGLRQQTEKLSSEIRKTYKTSFRTVTETTDTQSRSYVLQNTSEDLINYELRRKMRRVGVQLQDYGTSLCWQTYVDDPGQELGVGLLVHMAQAPALEQIKEPEQAAMPEPFIRAPAVALTATWVWEDRQYGFIPVLGRLELSPPKAGYVFDRAECVYVAGENMHFEARPDPATKHTVDLGGGAIDDSYRAVDVGVVTAPDGLETNERPSFTVSVTVIWRAHKDLAAKITADNIARINTANEEKKTLYTEALFKAAKDRVKAASSVRPRKFEDLREEERIVIYRNLVRQLLAVAGLDFPDDKVRHVFAEMVQALFDVDRMLYFVAPEWWAPRLMFNMPFFSSVSSPQDVGLGGQASTFNSKNVVSWGGAAEAARKDNYYITEDSDTARFGSSLGWLLQLDGDTQRNAFLNSPWVKAVLPVRYGKEWDALGWLSSPKLEGAEGLDLLYGASSASEQQKILEVLKAHTFKENALI